MDYMPHWLKTPMSVPWEFTNWRISLVRNTARTSSLDWLFTSAFIVGGPCWYVWLVSETSYQKKIANDPIAFNIPTQKVSTGFRISFTSHPSDKNHKELKCQILWRFHRSNHLWTLAANINLKDKGQLSDSHAGGKSLNSKTLKINYLTSFLVNISLYF